MTVYVSTAVTACDLCPAEVDGPIPDSWTAVTAGATTLAICPNHHRRGDMWRPRASDGETPPTPKQMRRMVALQIAMGAPVNLAELDPIERDRMRRLVKMAKRRLRAQKAEA